MRILAPLRLRVRQENRKSLALRVTPEGVVALIPHDLNPDHDPSLRFLAVDDAQNDIAGLSFCHPKTAEDLDMAWIDELGVRRPWRRRGLGLALLRHSFGELYRRGKHKVGLGVDAQSLTGAVRLYEKAGMHVDRQYATYEKELRPGEELSSQSVEG